MNFKRRIQRVTGVSACCAGCAGMNRTFGMGGFWSDLVGGITGSAPASTDPNATPSAGTQVGTVVGSGLQTAINIGGQWVTGQLGGGTSGQPNNPGQPANPAPNPTPASSSGSTAAVAGGGIALAALLGIGAYLMMK